MLRLIIQYSIGNTGTTQQENVFRNLKEYKQSNNVRNGIGCNEK